MKIAFYTPQLTFRGSCVALYDYAHYCEILYGFECVVITPKNNSENSEIAWKWISSRFPVWFVSSIKEAENRLLAKQFDLVYVIKHGQFDSVVFTRIPFVVHCVFDMSAPHSKQYVAVSESLAKKFGKTEYVPHIVSMKRVELPSLRKSLKIPVDAIVFGRYGGLDTFNLEFAKKVISKLVRENTKIWFLFMNTPEWDDHPHIIHLPSISNQLFKQRFIQTCDAMVVPEMLGHTFGLAIGEFCKYKKPIICFNGSVWNKAHLDILGNDGLYFSNENELEKLLVEFKKKDGIDSYSEFSPKNVMKKFKSVFLD